MKIRLYKTVPVVLAACGFLSLSAARGDDVGTAFTYQGQLKQGGVPVNDTCDFEFGLWDDPTAGGQVGNSPQSKLGVSVTNGLFAVTLDFDTGAFNGSARWLGIRLSCPQGSPFVPLVRQELTPAPYALALPGLWTQQNAFSPNLIGGNKANSVTAGVVGATISGGGFPGGGNRVTDLYGTIGGGGRNQAGNDSGSTQDVTYSTVGGGYNNTASGGEATVGGGALNEAAGGYATIGGGSNNVASGLAATVPGGMYNTAQGDYSFAAGQRAKVRSSSDTGDYDGDEGTFVWADRSIIDADFTSSGPNQFLIRAAGGVGIGTNDPGGYALNVNGPVNATDLLINGIPVGSGSGGISGGGTANHLAKFTGPTAIGDSIIFEEGGNVGIGTQPDPEHALKVEGRVHVTKSIKIGANSGTITTSYPDPCCYPGICEINDCRKAVCDEGGTGPASCCDPGGWTGGPNDDGVCVAEARLQCGVCQDTTTEISASGPSGTTTLKLSSGRKPKMALTDKGDAGTTADTHPNWFLITEHLDVGIGIDEPEAKLHVLASEGSAVLGRSTADRGLAHGVHGETASNGTEASGVYGYADAPDGETYGVWGKSDSSNGIGVKAEATDDAGVNYGLHASTASARGYAGYFEGTVQVNGDLWYTGDFGQISDARVKKNVHQIDDSLEKLGRLRGVHFDWRREDYPHQRFSEGRQVGFVAQEVRKVLPEVVSRNRDGFYCVDYGRVVPTLVEAVKELHGAIKERDRQIGALEARLTALETLANPAPGSREGDTE